MKIELTLKIAKGNLNSKRYDKINKVCLIFINSTNVSCSTKYYIKLFYRKKVSKEQLEVLIKERTKPKNEQLPWITLVHILNHEGPCIKSAVGWKAVNF